jgi:hypothetical protein
LLPCRIAAKAAPLGGWLILSEEHRLVRNRTASSLLALTVALSFAAPVPLLAQEATGQVVTPTPSPAPTEPEEPEVSDNEILVIAQSLRGSVDAPVPPVLELNQEDIAAYGAGSIAELISALGPQTGSGSGRGGGFPVILVNGVRISSFRELRSYPPEAIEKVEVFPEEVAQRYGYSPDQRVVNFILKRNYSSREVEGTYGQPWDGGYSTQEVEATYLQLIGESRLNFNLDWNNSSLLTEAERGVIQTTGVVPLLAGDPDPALYRSLIADSAGIEATGNFSTRIATGTSLSLNATFERNDSLRFQGLDTVLLTDPNGAQVLRSFNADDPLTVDSRTTTYSLGSTVNTSLGDWQITGTADASRAESRSVIDRRVGSADLLALQNAAQAGTLALDADLDVADAGFDRADTRSDTASGKVTAMGRPVTLPGGDVSVTLDAGYDYTNIASRDTRNLGVETSLTRGDVNGGVNLGIPITSRREEFAAGVGDLSLNLSGGIDHLSDFGTLTDWSAGVNWSPLNFERLSLSANYVVRDAAPSLSQLGNPEIATFNVPVYDLTRGETVLATIVTGGNPTLPAQTQRDWRFQLNWQLPDFTKAIQQGRLSVEFFKNHSEDVASGFPVLTPTTEAAFPGRVTRDATGRLLTIDQRPVTFAQQDSERIQVGLNFTGPFGKPRPQAAAAAQANNPFARLRQATQGAGAPGAGAPANGGQGPAGGPGSQAGGGQGGQDGGGFNPQAFQQIRARFCRPETANTVPTAEDIAALPPQLLARLKNEDGTVNPERWAEFRNGVCNGNVQFGGGDPAQFAALRERMCGKPGEEPRPITEQEIAQLPQQMQDRLKGPDGKIDPERLAQLRTRFCSADFGQGGRRGQGGQGGPGGQGQGGVFVFGGPPGGAPGGAQGGGPVIITQGPGQGGGPGGGGPGGPGGGGFRGPGGPGGFGGGGSADGRGRWFVNFNYTHELKNEVLIAPGGPLLDLLSGDAISGGGQPRDTLNFNGGLFYAGFGGNVNARYIGSSRINGSGLPGSTDLVFDDYAIVNLRVFADLNQRTKLIEQVPLLKNTRVSLALNNVFDTRQRVTDSAGTVPLRYQPFLVDPVGRSFSIELRKLF